MKTGIGLVCPTLISREELQIDDRWGSCENIIAKIALEKMGIKIEPHPHPYNVNWVDKTTQPIIQHCRVPIRMSRDLLACWYYLRGSCLA